MLSLLLALLLTPSPVVTQSQSTGQPGTVSGTVIDRDTRQPLPGAIVGIEGTRVETVTDVDGAFTLSTPPGEWTVRVLMVGFGLTRVSVSVRPGQSVQQVVTLAPGTAPVNQSVTVLGDPFGRRNDSVAGEFSLGTGDLLALRGVLTDDPFRAVQSAPSAAAADDFRAEFAVRGNGPRQISLTLDGIDSRLLMHSVRGVEDTGSLALFNTDVLADARLTAGTAPILNRGRIGASLDFHLRDGARDRFSARAAISGTSASIVAEGPVGRHASILFSARKSYLDWLLRKVDDDTDETFGFSDALVRFAWTPTARHTLRVTLLGGQALLKNFEQDGGPNTLDTGRGHTVGGVLEWQSRWSSAQVTHRFTLLDADYRNEVRSGRGTREAGSDRELMWRSDGAWQVRATLLAEGGLRADRRTVRREARHFSDGAALVLFDAQRTSTGGAGWTQLTWSPASRGDVSVGVRAESWSGSTMTWSPWALGTIHLTERMTLRGGTSMRHQHPDPEEQMLARTPLAPERAWTADLGLEFLPTTEWRTQVTAWRRRERNGLFFAGEPRLDSGVVVEPAGHLANRLRVESQGLEVLVQRRVATGLSGWFGYALSHTTATDAATGETFDGDFDQRHGVSAWFSWRPSARWSAQLRWRHSSNAPVVGYITQRDDTYWLTDRRNRVRLPTYSRVDARLDRAFVIGRRRLTLFVEVINLLNRTNVGPGDRSLRVSTGQVRNVTEDLFPWLPSVGLLFEF